MRAIGLFPLLFVAALGSELADALEEEALAG